jgi:hypothetical protein
MAKINSKSNANRHSRVSYIGRPSQKDRLSQSISKIGACVELQKLSRDLIIVRKKTGHAKTPVIVGVKLSPPKCEPPVIEKSILPSSVPTVLPSQNPPPVEPSC